MQRGEELKESESFAANTTGSSNSNAFTEAVVTIEEILPENPVHETCVGFPSFNNSISVNQIWAWREWSEKMNNLVQANSLFQAPTIAQFTKVQSCDINSSKQYPSTSNYSSIEVPNICTLSNNSETYSATSSQQDCSCEDHDEDDDGDDDDLINVGTFPIQPRFAEMNQCVGA